MSIRKRAVAFIVVTMIIIGTVMEPVSALADSSSIFGRSWFYNAGEAEGAGQSGSITYYEEGVAPANIVAKQIYNYYMWYYKYNNNIAVEGKYVHDFMNDTNEKYDASASRSGSALTFQKSFITGGNNYGEPIHVDGEYIFGIGGYYKQLKESPFIFYTAGWESNLNRLHKDTVKNMPMTPEVTKAFENLYEVMVLVKNMLKRYYNFVSQYIPEQMRDVRKGYTEEEILSAIEQNIGSDRKAFADKYEEFVNALSQNTNGYDGLSMQMTERINKTKENAGIIIDAHRSYTFYLGGKVEPEVSNENTYIGTSTSLGERDRYWIDTVMESMPYIRDDIINLINKVYISLPADLANASGADAVAGAESEVGSIEKSLAEFVVSIGSQISRKLTNNSISLNTIVFGRIENTGGIRTPVNYFTFELQKKNPYGLVGAVIFSLLRVLLVLGVFIYAMLYLVKASFVLDAKTLAKIKGDAAYLLGAIVLLIMMPNLIDGAMWIRDQFLGAIQSELGEMGSITGQALSDAQDGRFVSAAEYLGMVLLSFYFGFSYISAACSMMIMFGMFPVFVIFGLSDKKMIGEWFKFMIGIILIPVIDAILLFVPHIASTRTSMPTLVQIILCMSIIPSRGVVRQMLGFGRSAGAELVGIGAMIAAGRAIGGVARTAKNAVGGAVSGVTGAVSDHKASKAYGELAKEDHKLVETAKADKANDRALFDGGAGWNHKGSNEESGQVSVRDSEFGSRDMALGGTDQDFFGQGTDEHGNIESISDGAERREAGLLKPQMGSYGGSGSASPALSTERAQRQKILAKAATLSNFDTKFDKELSNEQKAELYKKRAVVGAVKTAFGTAGTAVVGTMGGTLGAAGGMMFGPTAMIAGAGFGFAAGGQIGGAVVGSATGTLTNATYSGISGRMTAKQERLQQEAEAAEYAEYLQKDNNLGYEMYTGDQDADIMALDQDSFVTAQSARWDNCKTDEAQFEELRNQRAIIERANFNAITGEEASDEQKAAIGRTRFYQTYRTNLESYQAAHEGQEMPNDPISYGYYSQPSVKNWTDTMFTTDPREGRRLLNDHMQSNRMGMLILSARDNYGVNSSEYRNARFATQKIISFDSGAVAAGNPTYVSNSFEAGRVWNRFGPASESAKEIPGTKEQPAPTLITPTEEHSIIPNETEASDGMPADVMDQLLGKEDVNDSQNG